MKKTDIYTFFAIFIALVTSGIFADQLRFTGEEKMNETVEVMDANIIKTHEDAQHTMKAITICQLISPSPKPLQGRATMMPVGDKAPWNIDCKSVLNLFNHYRVIHWKKLVLDRRRKHETYLRVRLRA